MAESRWNSANARSVLRPLVCEIANQIDVEVILPYMRRVFDKSQVERIRAEKTSFQQNERLLSTVVRMGPNGLSNFMRSLDECYPNIASRIQNSKTVSEQPTQISAHPCKVKGPDQAKVLAVNGTLDGKQKYLLRKDATQFRKLEGDILRKNRMKLCKMDEKAVLSQCRILNNEHNVQKINARQTHLQRVETLLDILVRLGPDAFEEFINAVNILDPDLGMPLIEELIEHNLICSGQ